MYLHTKFNARNMVGQYLPGTLNVLTIVVKTLKIVFSRSFLFGRCKSEEETMLEKFFKLKEHGTTVSTEVLAGFTTFFTMAYILFVNPSMLAETGLTQNGVYIATILSAVVGTTIMSLFANLPYAQAAGMGLNAFFTYTVVFKLGYTPYEALAMVFVCGVFNILITITRIRVHLIAAIPETLKQAIGAGIGLFIAYIGFLNVGFFDFGSGVPAIVDNFLTNPGTLLFLIGLVITVILMLTNVKGAILIGIIATTIIGIPMDLVDLTQLSGMGATSYGQVFKDFAGTFGKALSAEGIVSLFKNHNLFQVFSIVFAFSMADTFDTIGTFIGTGRRSGIFTQEDEEKMISGTGLSTRLDRGLFADSIASSIGAVLGTSNVTTFVESSAGIEAGGRTGLTSLTVSGLFLLSIVAAPVIGLVPTQATAPALVIVGVLMSSAFADIEWTNLRNAIPAFFTVIMTVLSYSISNGLAFGFFIYLVVEIALGNWKKIHPIMYVSTLLFLLSFILN